MIAQGIRNTQGLVGGRADLFCLGEFLLRSGNSSSFEIRCDSLTDGDIRALVFMLFERLPRFGDVEGIMGGLRIAAALREYSKDGEPILIVDDVLTSGSSMEEARAGRYAMGAVLFARGVCPGWVTPLFQLAARRVH